MNHHCDDVQKDNADTNSRLLSKYSGVHFIATLLELLFSWKKGDREARNYTQKMCKSYNKGLSFPIS